MLSQAKIYIGIAVAIAFGLLYWQYDVAVKEAEILQLKVDEAYARHERDAAKILGITAVADANRAMYDEAILNIKHKLDQINDLNLEMQKHKGANDALVKLFSDHDFAKLLQAKPGLVQSRMRSATKRLFKQLEEASTGTGDSLQGPSS
jgi:hypothetical protein